MTSWAFRSPRTQPKQTKPGHFTRRSGLAFLAGAVAFALLGMPGAPTTEAKTQLTDKQQTTLAKINDYFNSIYTMEGDFVEFGPNGERAEGQFYLSRPGKIRFHYQPPARIDIIADGQSISVKDCKLQTQDIWPLSKTPLRFLLSNKIDLTSDANVTSVSVEPDLVTVIITEDGTFVQGKLTLIFDAQTQELKQWTVTDEQGLDTSVAIYNVKDDVALNNKMFVIDYLANTRQKSGR
ncbi:outer-membrane lipoprotein carrier protein LolA [Breoghania sp.]|uniref:LolA family protein n=1 Tax=Breoghania sp. TaxID=2065378 RepID=UPI00261CD8F8|nr:outer-membrane lipoprotein carrier protein LolA [Breoghania sp.]MDJ0931443.1 outer-membrane lipoprotein carrier protein LolA [Breoghania sp.]